MCSGAAYRIVAFVVRPSTSSKDLFSEATWPISIKFHMQPPGKGRKKYIFGPGHKTKMAAVPKYDKTLNEITLINYSRITRPIALKLGM